MNLANADRTKLGHLLDELAQTVEALLLSGLTTASESTRRLFEVSFQEAARMRLLRLGSTLRAANEELGRFTLKKDGFSRRRLCFFLTRAWLLCQGLARALREGDDKEFDRLLRTPTGQPVERLEVVTLGVSRKTVPGSFCAIDFRLRNLANGDRVLWSCVFPMAPGQDVPAEGFLHLPQKQQFKAQQLLEGKVVTFSSITFTPDGAGGGRISLGEKSTVTLGAPFTDWERFAVWNANAALDRLRRHEPGPLELDVELQEEVVLRNWEVGSPIEEDDGQAAYPIVTGPITFHALVGPGSDGKPVREALDARRGKKNQPPLFALLHYERCRLALQPLALFAGAKMDALTLSSEKVNLAALLKTIKF